MTVVRADIAASADIAEGSARDFSVGEGDWPLKGVVLRFEGKLYAWVNSCPHAGHALNLSPDDFFTPDGSYIRCMSHGAQFEPDTGVCVAGPCPGQKLTGLECEEAGGRIIVTAPDTMRGLKLFGV